MTTEHETQEIESLLATERERVNQKWLDAFSAVGLRRQSSHNPMTVVTDIRFLMLKEFSTRLKERRSILEKHNIKDEPNPTKPVFRYE